MDDLEFLREDIAKMEKEEKSMDVRFFVKKLTSNHRLLRSLLTRMKEFNPSIDIQGEYIMADKLKWLPTGFAINDLVIVIPNDDKSHFLVKRMEETILDTSADGTGYDGSEAELEATTQVITGITAAEREAIEDYISREREKMLEEFDKF